MQCGRKFLVIAILHLSIRVIFILNYPEKQVINNFKGAMQVTTDILFG